MSAELAVAHGNFPFFAPMHPHASTCSHMPQFSVFKELAGVSRKYAIPLLEYFDREKITRRAGDKRLVL